MLKIMRWRTALELQEAVLLLREQLGEAAPSVADKSPAMGCCGCGAWMADVRTPGGAGAPWGESYCWPCVDSPRHNIPTYVVLPGRGR